MGKPGRRLGRMRTMECAQESHADQAAAWRVCMEKVDFMVSDMMDDIISDVGWGVHAPLCR
jgi:hypothetical protein